jgi:hypothetical protein
MRKQCQFRGGAGLKEKYRPASPCLDEFVVGRSCNWPRQKYCKVCAPFAKRWLSAQNAAARYKAEPRRFAKITRENRWKRRKAAGRPCPRLGLMVPCEYRDERGRRGKGCLGKFERRSSVQKFCAVCQKSANRDIARKSRKAHLAEIKRRDSLRHKREREALRELTAGATKSPRPARMAGRPIAQATPEMIALAARLERDGLKPYQMTDQLCPPEPGLSEKEKAATRHKRFHDRVDPFLRRKRKEIDLEKQRLAALPEAAEAP